MTEERRPPGELVADAVELAATMGAAAVGVTAQDPVLAAGLAALPSAARRLVDKVRSSLATGADVRLRLWLEHAAAAMNLGTPERVAEALAERIDEQPTRDALRESFRVMLAALDEAAMPAIARVFADSMEQNRGPGTFHRRFGNILAECGRPELVALSATVDFLAGVFARLELAPTERLWVEANRAGDAFILQAGQVRSTHPNALTQR